MKHNIIDGIERSALLYAVNRNVRDEIFQENLAIGIKTLKTI